MRSTILAAITGAVLLAACTAPTTAAAPAEPTEPVETPADTSAQTPEATAEMRVLSEAQKGETVTLKVGETFKVALTGTPTAGYVWAEKDVPAFLTKGEKFSANTVPEQSQPGFVGGNHVLGFTYTAAAVGTGTLSMAYARPWETSEPPTDTWSVQIVVE
jgi:predicted secreted protein